MKLNYYEDTNSLYIDLSTSPGSRSEEIADGVVVDYNEAGHAVGIDIQNVPKRMSRGPRSPQC
jgi:uncharacterized protein YuzE